MNTDLARRNEGRLAQQARAGERATVSPPVDVYENDDEVLLLADVPGATKDAIEIRLDQGQLTIDAHRSGVDPGPLIAGEYRTGDFRRVFVVPQGIDPSKIDARLDAGVLHLRLPKSESIKPRRIEVRAG